jgi:tetratricopeptide (TPR) repeat protein
LDDHASPILELERLLKVFRAYEYMNEGDLLMENKDMNGAMTAYNAAMKLFPQNLEMKYWTAITLANNKETDKAISLLKKIYAKDANWRELTKRIRKVGLLTVSDTDFAKLIQ